MIRFINRRLNGVCWLAYELRYLGCVIRCFCRKSLEYGSCDCRDEFPKEFPVADGYTPRTVNADDILVELTNLYYQSGFVPFSGVRSNLILNSH